MTRCYLVRHGAVDPTWLGRRCYGDLDIALSAEGEEQSRRLPGRLAAAELAAVYSSPLERTLLPARLLSARLQIPHCVRPDLREVFRGRWRGLSWEEIETGWPGERARFAAEPEHCNPYGGETLAQVSARVLRTLSEIADAHPEEAVAIIAHTWVVRSILCHTLGLELRLCERLVLAPASISAAELAPPRVLNLNLVDPLPLNSKG